MNNMQQSARAAGTVRIGDFYANRVGFGAMRITGPGIWGEPEDHQAAIALLKRAVDLDCNFIDTADAYGPEVSENLIAEALHPYAGVIVATKGGNLRPGPGVWQPDCTPKHLREACEASLKRLGVGRLDLYQLHTVDPKVPFKDSFATLLELQSEGKIRHIGLSNIEPEQFATALGMGKFVSVQNNYNILNREHEDVLTLCEEQGIAFIPYFPMGGGRPGSIADKVLNDVAEKQAVTAHQVALAWLLTRSPVMLPIPGTSSIEHLEQNVAAASIKLSSDDIERLNNLA
jgi:aryl-alcohol dehydrogenase-like predicted oxidoreductase